MTILPGEGEAKLHDVDTVEASLLQELCPRWLGVDHSLLAIKDFGLACGELPVLKRTCFTSVHFCSLFRGV